MNKILILPALLLMNLTGCNNTNTEPDSVNGDFSNELTSEEIKNAVLTPEILWKLGRVSDLQLSPDGKTALYTVTRYDIKTDKKHTWIFSVAVSGGEPVNLTEQSESCSSPRWIDNDHIAFLSKTNDRSEIWSMKTDGTAKHTISDIAGDVNAFGFSPDGKKVFYLQDVKIDLSPRDLYPDLPLTKAIIADDLMYRHWDSWHDYAYSHIFIAELEQGKIKSGKDIMEGETWDSPLSPYFNVEEIAWNHDGTVLAYTCKKIKGKEFAESTNSDIYLYENGKTINITEGMPGYDRYPVFSPDGKKLSFISMETPGYESDKERLFIYNLENGTKKYLTESFDQPISHCLWSDDGKKIIFISGINATFQVYEISSDTGTIRQITRGIHDYNAIAFKNGVLCGTKTDMVHAAEVFRINAETGAETQLSFTNRKIYGALKTPGIEQRWVKTTDDKKMLVWLVLPPDFDSSKKYPALLYCQGGPQSAVSQFFSYRWNLHLMAASGYIVIAPNRRGLPTFGSEWNKQISGDYGGQNIRDYLSATDEIKKEIYVDSDRLGAVGASYGGYSVLFLAGHHEKRFKAFIAHCGMFNLESQSSGTEEMFFVHHDLGGYYWDNPKPESFTKFSPHTYVDKWDTPIMLITGMNDFRIPYTESLQAFNIAQLRGIQSKLLVFPDENHWITKPQNSLLWQREFFGWLDKFLK
jgi:dipeptidyl aminopeptidase/acylaminoacyl peptidase